jgi:chromosome partitioning protein
LERWPFNVFGRLQFKPLDGSSDDERQRGLPMRKLAFVSLKGGVGKTVSATAIAVGLAKRGLKTLVVDADQQANSTWTLLGGQGSDPPTLGMVLTREASAVEAIRQTTTPGLDLLPADSSLGGVNVALAQELGRDTRLRSALVPLDGQYDYVIFDTGPQLTTVLVNVLVYAVEVIVPLDPGVYAMLGLVALEDTIAEVREAYSNPALHMGGLLLTKMSRNNVCRDVETELRSRYETLVFKTTVPLSTKVEEANTRGLCILDYAPKSPGALAYFSLVEEIVSHGQPSKRSRSKAIGRSSRTDAA